MDNAAAKANQFKTWQGVVPGWKKWNDLLRRQTMPVTDRFLELDVPKGSFDVVTMRWGLMFMPDALACLKRARAALKPGRCDIARLLVGAGEESVGVDSDSRAGAPYRVPTPPPGAPGLFAFADPSRLRSTMEDAGFSDVALEEIELPMTDFATGEEFSLTFTLEIAGAVAMLFARVPQEQRAAVAGEIAREVERAGGGRARLPGVTWFASARC